MKAIFVVLYFGTVIKSGLSAVPVDECQAIMDADSARISQSYAHAGFDPDGIEIKCVLPGQLILRAGVIL